MRTIGDDQNLLIILCIESAPIKRFFENLSWFCVNHFVTSRNLQPDDTKRHRKGKFTTKIHKLAQCIDLILSSLERLRVEQEKKVKQKFIILIEIPNIVSKRLVRRVANHTVFTKKKKIENALSRFETIYRVFFF